MDEIVSLRDALMAGELLLQSARLVGDPQDLLVWRLHRAAWLHSTTLAISRAAGDEATDALASAFSSERPESDWLRSFETERAGLEAALSAIAARC